MSSRVSNFQIGLFILCSIFLVLAALFWVGAMEFYQKTRDYVTYIDSSVEGLGLGSKIRYRGLEVGRVARIDLARDGELVRIDLKVQPDFRIQEDHAVQLKLKGITGERYLALVKASPDAKRIQPPESIEPEEPWIPSVPGQMERMVQGVRSMYREFRAVDVQGLASEWRGVAARANELLASEELSASLDRLNALASKLNALATDLRKAKPGQEWSSTMGELSRSARRAEELIASLERRVRAIEPKEVGVIPGRANAALAQIRESTNATGLRVQSTAVLLQQSILELNRVLSEIRVLARSLKRDPGRILTRPENTQDPFGR
jgi:ABC-type transporter Mla subunit MlaD